MRLEDRADVLVVVDHRVVILALPATGLAEALRLRTCVRKCMWVKLTQRKNGLSAFDCRSMKSTARGGGVVVDRLHPLLRQRAGVLDRLLADLAEARVHGRVVDVRGLAVQHAARAELLAERRVLGIVAQLGLFLGVQVVEVAVELVEAVDRGQKFVAVAQVVLAELAGGVAVRLEQLGDRRVLLLEARAESRACRPWSARCEAVLAGDERRAAGRAALLGVVVGEDHPFLGDAVDVRRAVAHHPHRVGADVRLADVVAPDDDDVGLLPPWAAAVDVGKIAVVAIDRRLLAVGRWEQQVFPVHGAGLARIEMSARWRRQGGRWAFEGPTAAM